VPNLLPRAVASGNDPWSEKGKLVEQGRGCRG
jgi:hypothetical protein